MEFAFGSGVLTGVRTDVVSYTPIRFGALQNVDVEFSGEIKELFSFNQYPIDTARGKTKVSGKAKMAEIRARAYNDLFFGQTMNTGSLRYSWNESVTLGTGAASYTVANSASTPLTDQGVFYITTGNQLTGVSSVPGSGSYTFTASTGVYSFNSSDAGAGVYVNYTYTASSGFNIPLGNPLMGNTPRFSVTLFEQFETTGGVPNQLVLRLNACVSTRLTFPTRIDDYWIEDLDFSAFADAGGNVGAWNSSY